MTGLDFSTGNVVETDRAIIKISLKNQTEKEREKAFKEIAQASYRLCKYEFEREAKQNATTT